MAYISLYRKWRPQTFQEVAGQDHVTRTLSNAIEQDRISHAYLFSGPRGTGKTTVAKILAKAINCQKGPTPTPCNECDNCQEITDGSSLDVLEIDAASNRGIDEIRDLREKVHYAPAKTKVKVYIIDEVHMLTPEAFNALLKTLEEPPLHVIFVLATTEPHKVIATIVSRCQQFDFRRISISDIKERLREIAQAEKIEIDDAGLYLIAKNGQGSLRDAIGALDQLSSFTAGKIELDDVISLLGAVDLELLFEMTDMVLGRDASACLEFVERLTESGRDLRQFTKELLEHFHNLLVIKNVDQPEAIVDTTPENIHRMQKQAEQAGVSELIRITDILAQTLSDMRWNPDAKLYLETALIKLVRPEVDVSVESLVARMEELEKRVGMSNVLSPKSKVQSEKPTSDERLAMSDEGRRTKDEGAGSREQRAVREDSGVEAENSKPEEPEPKHRKTETSPSTVHRPPSTAQGQKPTSDERPVTKGEGRRTKDEAKIDITKVKRVWSAVLDQIKKKKISTYALLLECQPVKVNNQEITIAFNEGASFHRQEIEKSQNLQLLRAAFKEVLGGGFSVRCTLGEEIIESVADESSSGKQKPEGEIEETVPRPHIVKLVQDSFEAEVIDQVDLE